MSRPVEASRDSASTQGTSTRRSAPIVIEPARRLFDLDLKELWRYRSLAYNMAIRDTKIRYKQTLLGITWAVLPPLMTMVVFTVIFGRLLHVSSGGAPYPVFAYAALLPWAYFSKTLSMSSDSVVGASNLVSKIYFPRLLLPMAAVITPLLDFAIGLLILAGLMTWFRVLPTWAIVLLPLFLLLSTLTALAGSLWFSALNVRYRDVRQVIPFLLQFGMYASPIIYPVSAVPERWRFLYSLNPMAGVIEGFRWAVLGKYDANFLAMAIGTGGLLVLFVGGLVYFKRVERTFADVV